MLGHRFTLDKGHRAFPRESSTQLPRQEDMPEFMRSDRRLRNASYRRVPQQYRVIPCIMNESTLHATSHAAITDNDVADLSRVSKLVRIYQICNSAESISCMSGPSM